MLIAIYHVLKYGIPFRDLGANDYNGSNREHKTRGYLKRLKSLGWVPDIPLHPPDIFYPLILPAVGRAIFVAPWCGSCFHKNKAYPQLDI